jgi:hypothetical protein
LYWQQSVEEVVPVVLVIIILVAWAVILGPGLIKRRALSGSDQSITSFHDQLRVLEHSAPEPIVTPAYRLRSVDGSGSPTGITYPDSGKPPVLTVVGVKELPRPALAFLGEPVPDDGTSEPDAQPARAERIDGTVAAIDRGRGPRDEWALNVPPPSDETAGPAYSAAGPAYPAAGPRSLDAFARKEARSRRRATLSVLAVVFVTTLLLSTVTGATALWALCALDGMALVAYMALLVHLRRMAVERERKLHYLEPRADARPARTGGPATYVSGRYAHPSHQQAIAR